MKDGSTGQKGKNLTKSSTLFSPITDNQVPTLVQTVEKLLLKAIIEGELPLGSRISEAGFARQLGISRAPLREACRLFEQRGLFVTRPNKGFYVRKYTVDEIDEIYSVRQCLEKFALIECIEKADDTQLKQVEAQLNKLIKVAKKGNRSAVVDEDLGVHRAVCIASGNKRLTRMISDLGFDLAVLISRLSDLGSDPKIVAESHVELVEAILSRDAEKATKALETHIVDAWNEMRSKAELLWAAS